MSRNVLELIEYASDAALVIDRNRRIVAWNSLAEGLLGYSSEEVSGEKCGAVLRATIPGGETLCHPDCDPVRCFRDHHPYRIRECKLLHRDSYRLDADISSIAIADDTGAQYSEDPVAIIMLRDNSDGEPARDVILQAFTLGGFNVTAAGRCVDTHRWKRKQAVTLLKYLITQLDRQVHFERLIDCLWSDVDESHGRERVENGDSIWRGHIRHVQGEEAQYFGDLRVMSEFLRRVTGVTGLPMTENRLETEKNMAQDKTGRRRK